MALHRDVTRRLALRYILGAGTAAIFVSACQPAAAPAPSPSPANTAPTTAPTSPALAVAPSPAPTSAAPVATPAAQPTIASKESITIQFASENPVAPDTPIGLWIKTFNQSYPNIHIDAFYMNGSELYKKLLAAAAAHTLPDFMEIYGPLAQQWIQQGSFVGLDEYLKADREFDVQDFFPRILRMYQWKGQTWALPYDNGPEILGYNTELFAQAGVAPPTADWTVDDLVNAARKLTKAGQTWGYYGMPKSWTVHGMGLGPWGGLLVNEEETECLINSTESQTALQWWADLQLKHKVAPTDAEVSAFKGNLFFAGKIAMTRSAPWDSIDIFKHGIGAKWDVAPWPKGPKAQQTSEMGSGYAITVDSKHRDATWAFMRSMESKEGLSYVWGKEGDTPPRASAFKSFLDSPYAPKHAEYFYDAMKDPGGYAVLGRPISPVSGQVTDIVNRELSQIFLGQVSVRDAVTSIKQQVDPLLAKNKSQ